ncbi:MAG: hypothetical protein AAB490_02475 [Patescibacteria group bacterium]
MLIFLSIVIVFKTFQDKLFNYRNIASSLLLACISVLQYYMLIVISSMVIHGTTRYVQAWSSVVEVTTMMIVVLAYTIGIQCVILGFSTLRGHERQSV